MNTDMKEKYIFDAVKYLNKYCEYYKSMCDNISKIVVLYKEYIIINIQMKNYNIEIKWAIPDQVQELEGNGTKADYIILAVDQILNRLIITKEKND